MDAVASDFRTIIADRIEASHQLLASRWLEELKHLVAVSPNDIFPGDQLLGHMPALIQEIAAFFRAPAHESIVANAVVTARATELGRLRHAQRASVHQVLRECRTLRTTIAQFIEGEIAHLQLAPSAHDVIELMSRLEAAVALLLQTTLDTFVAAYTDTITQHTTRLEGLNRMVMHELRQPIGVLLFAAKLLGAEDTWTDPRRRDQLVTTIQRNAAQMNETLAKLLALSRAGDATEAALVHRIELATLARAVFEQLREMADARGVDLRVGGPLPTLTVDVARLELVFVNLISNAIKYSDSTKPVRFVEITSPPSEDANLCTVSLRDNGIGIDERELRSIFKRFYRGHRELDGQSGTSGLGLGLSIVADCIEVLNGDIRVESAVGQGTTFILQLPISPGG